jgi:hypothetical protein
MRAAHSKLQQAIYEAAQVQRRLCAPRELVSGEFEIAGEIFPVRHLSGDFFPPQHYTCQPESVYVLHLFVKLEGAFDGRINLWPKNPTLRGFGSR